MKSKAERIKEAWRDNYSISSSQVQICGDMICHNCKKKIKGSYLIIDRTNYMMRGNENDERYLFHRNCSQNNIEWIKFDAEHKKHKKYLKTKRRNKMEANTRQKLFDYFSEEHNVSLLESDFNEIEYILSLQSNEWVRVEDRLPEDEINVLCYHIHSGNYFICFRTKDCNTQEPKWHGGSMPTHWKPLTLPNK